MITQAMSQAFNDWLGKRGSDYRIIKSEGNDYSWEITLPVDIFERHRPMIYPNKEFYNELEMFFSQRGIKIVYNNTKSIFWTN